MKRTIATLSSAFVILVSSVVLAGDKHPNLVNAGAEIQNARLAITAAQQANEFDLGGHAKNAKALLDQAAEEVRLARGEAK